MCSRGERRGGARWSDGERGPGVMCHDPSGTAARAAKVREDDMVGPDRRWRRNGAAAALATMVATVAVIVLPGADAAVRNISEACPPGQVPEDGFTDVPADNTHEAAIDCIVWWGIAQGTTSTTYAPGNGVRRDQMASFLVRLLERAGYKFPANPPNAFDDDNGNAHEANIDKLASVAIVGGTGPRQYSPARFVDRAQMASFLARSYEKLTGDVLPASKDYFTDDESNVHEPNINKIAEAGFTAGATATEYRPANPVFRDAMASFLARVLDKLVEEEGTTCPGASSTSSSSSSSSSSTSSSSSSSSSSTAFPTTLPGGVTFSVAQASSSTTTVRTCSTSTTRGSSTSASSSTTTTRPATSSTLPITVP
jgi:hypothetical protein